MPSLRVLESPTSSTRVGISIPIVFSYASSLTDEGAALLREHNQYISITPESESTNGYARPVTHRIQDQAALGTDTHFTFSSDILTQERLWLQSVRRLLTSAVLETRRVAVNSPQSVAQAFLLATRHRGLALRRDDLGVISVGAKADIVVWNGNSPALLGWNDLVAAVLLHAIVGDIEYVIVNGKWKKKDFKLAVEDYPEIVERFLASVKRI